MSYFEMRFWIFIILSLFVYYLVPAKARKYILLICNMYFFYICGIHSFLYMLCTLIVSYFGTLLMSELAIKRDAIIKEHKGDKELVKHVRSKYQKERSFVLLLSILIPLLFLCYVKYTRAIIDSFEAFKNLRNISIVVPIGISFYTFQAIGYVIDVYNENYDVERSFPQYALFISFFPQIVQGPISRYDYLGIQLKSPVNFDSKNIKQGLIFVLWGAFKKLTIADRIAPFVSTVTGTAFSHSGSVALVTVSMYAIELYADFSGGIDIAKGVSLMFGIRLPENFKRPYFSVSMGDFWRRWHITLGSWMRDYIFYPLAVSSIMQKITKSVKKNNKYIAKVLPAIIGNIVVFLIVGIWHGAKLTFVAWGLYNGIILAISAGLEKYYETFRSNHKSLVESRPWHLFRIFRTFLLVLLGYFFDCAHTLRDGFAMIGALVRNFAASDLVNGRIFGLGLTLGSFIKLIPAVLILIFVSVLQENNKDIISWIDNRKALTRYCIYSFLVCVFIFFSANGYGEAGGFMYAIF